MVNHLTVGANTFNKNAFSPNVDQNWKDKVCIKNAVDCNQNFGAITFSEFSTWGAASYNGTKQPRFTVKDDVTFIKGSHTIKTGFTYDRQQANGFGQQDYGGSAGFDFKQTGVPGVTNFATAGGSSFASFLLGYAHSGRTETIRYLQQVYPYYGFYAQDDWRMNDKFVLNYGVRYEFTRPPVAGGDQYSEFDPTKPNPGVNGYPGALIFAGEGEGREGKRSLIRGLLRLGGAAVERRLFAQRQDDDSRRRRPLVRPRHGHFGHEPLRGLHRPVPVPQRRLGRHADVHARSGTSGVSAAAADQSGVLEQSATSTTGTATRRCARPPTTRGRSRCSAKCAAA